MRHRPLFRVLDRRTRRQSRAQFPDTWQCLHPLPPTAESRVLWIHGSAFLREAERERARQQIEVGQREFRPQEVIPAMRELPFSDLQAQLYLRKGMVHDLFVGGDAKLREDHPLVRHMVDHVRIVVGVDHADPLVHPRPVRDVSWLQRKPRKSLLDIRDDRTRLIDGEITVPQDWYPVEGMQCQVARFAHFRLQVMERVGHFLVGQHQPHNVDKGTARKPIDDWIGHFALPYRPLQVSYERQKGLAASSSACWRLSPMSASSRASWASSCNAFLWRLRSNQTPRTLRGSWYAGCASNASP